MREGPIEPTAANIYCCGAGELWSSQGVLAFARRRLLLYMPAKDC